MRHYSIFAAVGLSAFALTACQESVIKPLDGVFPAPEEIVLTELVDFSSEKGDGIHTFSLILSDGSVTLNTDLVASNYFVMPNSYGPSETAKNGVYLLSGTSVADAAGTHGVSSGTIIVSKSGDAKKYEQTDTYEIDAMLFCEGDSAYRLKWSGNLVCEPDPEAVRLVNLISANSNLASGVSSVSLSLATKDVSASYDMSVWSWVYSGSGNYLAVDLYSADGYLHEGTYKPCAVGGTIGEGEYGIGYDTSMWGMNFFNWGTCWWTVDNGSTSAEKIVSGDITVARSGSEWVITLNNDVVWAEFKGEIPALTSPDAPSYVSLSKLLSVTDYNAYGSKMVGVELATDGISYTPADWAAGIYTPTYSGSGNYLKLEVYSEDGTIAPGTYTACATGGAVGEGEFGIGYQGDWDASGTNWYSVADGVSTPEFVTDGTLTVSLEGSVYTITLQSSTVSAQYVGSLSN